MDDEEAKAIWYVLEELRKDGQDVDQERIPLGPDAERMFTLLDQITLQRRLRNDPSRAFQPGEVIQLRPPSRDADVAAVSCRRDTNGDAAWRFYLGLWRDGRFVGVRFEPPGDDENHSYYHSQLCSSMGDRASVPDALDVPERYPAWPLPAASSLELLLCLVVSIHGMAGFKDLQGRIKGDFAMEQNAETDDGDSNRRREQRGRKRTQRPARHRLLVKALDKIAGLPTARLVEP